jgi:hypothetical protein
LARKYSLGHYGRLAGVTSLAWKSALAREATLTWKWSLTGQWAWHDIRSLLLAWSLTGQWARHNIRSLLLARSLTGILSWSGVAALTVKLAAPLALALARERAVRLLRSGTRRHAGGCAVRRVDQAARRVDGRRGDYPVAVLIDDGGSAYRARPAGGTWHSRSLRAESILSRGLRPGELRGVRVRASRGELPAELALRRELGGHGLTRHRVTGHRLAGRRELPCHRRTGHRLAGGR